MNYKNIPSSYRELVQYNSYSETPRSMTAFDTISLDVNVLQP